MLFSKWNCGSDLLNNEGSVDLRFAALSNLSIRSDTLGRLTVFHINHFDHNCKCPAVKNNS